MGAIVALDYKTRDEVKTADQPQPKQRNLFFGRGGTL